MTKFFLENFLQQSFTSDFMSVPALTPPIYLTDYTDNPVEAAEKFESSESFELFKKQYEQLINELEQHLSAFQILDMELKFGEDDTNEEITSTLIQFSKKLFAKDFSTDTKVFWYHLGKIELEKILGFLNKPNIPRARKVDALLVLQGNCLDAKIKDTIQSISRFLAPIYLEFPSEEEAPKQMRERLQAFLESHQFTPFKDEFDELINLFKDLCIREEVIYGTDLVNEDGSTTQSTLWELFRHYLYIDSFFEKERALLYGQVKRELEALYDLLQLDCITSDKKKQILIELQKKLILCPAGLINHILDSLCNLHSEILGEQALLHQAKQTLIKQLALDFIKTNHEEVALETHYVAAYYNAVAENYGLPQVSDSYIPSLEIDTDLYQDFADYLLRELKPRLFSEYLTEQLVERFENEVLKPIKAFIEKTNPPFPFILNLDSELLKKIDSLLQAFNNKYPRLCCANLRWLILSDDEEKTFQLVTNQKLRIEHEVSRAFNKTFVDPKATRSLVLTHEDVCVYSEGANIWAESSEVPISLSPELFVQMQRGPQYNALTDLTYLNQFLNQPLGVEVRCLLENKLSTLKPYIELMVDMRFVKLIVILLENATLSPEEFTVVVKKKIDPGINTAWYLANWQEFDCFETLLKRNAFSGRDLGEISQKDAMNNGINKGLNALWFLVFYNEMDIFNLIVFEQKLITDQSVFSVQAEADVFEDYAGNIPWMLAHANDERALIELCKRKLLTQEHLNAAPTVGPAMGCNAVWGMVNHNNEALLRFFLENKLITQDALKKSSKNQDYITISAFALIFTAPSLHPLFDLFLEHGLITQASLEENVILKDSGDYFNLLCFLIQKKTPIELLQKLLENNLISYHAVNESGDKTFNAVGLLRKHCDLYQPFTDQLFERKLITKMGLYRSSNIAIHLDLNSFFAEKRKINAPTLGEADDTQLPSFGL